MNCLFRIQIIPQYALVLLKMYSQQLSVTQCYQPVEYHNSHATIWVHRPLVFDIMHSHFSLKLIYGKETPKCMQKYSVSLETQVGHHWNRIMLTGYFMSSPFDHFRLLDKFFQAFHLFICDSLNISWGR